MDHNENDISHLDFEPSPILTRWAEQVDHKLDEAREGQLVRVRRVKPKAAE
jgi:hypothetical protein